MIDYEELDERIRRIVREELGNAKFLKILKTLEHADKDRVYKDRYGDKWAYSGHGEWWSDSDYGWCLPEDVEHFGPFTEVVA